MSPFLLSLISLLSFASHVTPWRRSNVGHRPLNDSSGHESLLLDVLVEQGTTLRQFAAVVAEAAQIAWCVSCVLTFNQQSRPVHRSLSSPQAGTRELDSSTRALGAFERARLLGLQRLFDGGLSHSGSKPQPSPSSGLKHIAEQDHP